jgi:hypothetical protein
MHALRLYMMAYNFVHVHDNSDQGPEGQPHNACDGRRPDRPFGRSKKSSVCLKRSEYAGRYDSWRVARIRIASVSRASSKDVPISALPCGSSSVHTPLGSRVTRALGSRLYCAVRVSASMRSGIGADPSIANPLPGDRVAVPYQAVFSVQADPTPEHQLSVLSSRSAA